MMSMSNALNRKTAGSGSAMRIEPISDAMRKAAERKATEAWGATAIAAHGELYDLRCAPCFAATARDGGELLGYCYYRLGVGECEILALESVVQNAGVGSALIEAVKGVAAENNASRVFLETTNDNTHAIRFYQRRGFYMKTVRIEEMTYLRQKLKPSIPLLGNDDIPILHEIEFEMKI